MEQLHGNTQVKGTLKDGKNSMSSPRKN